MISIHSSSRTGRGLVCLGLLMVACVETAEVGDSGTGSRVDSGRDGSVATPDGSSRDAARADSGVSIDASIPDAMTPDAAFDSAVPVPESCEGGSVTYGVGGQHFRITLGATTTTQNLTEAFDALGGTGRDDWVALSPDGETYLVSTSRFDPTCEGWTCLAVVSADLSSYETVRVDGRVLHPARYPAIASGGRRIIFSEDQGGGLGLFVINLTGSGWTTPELLTGDSPYTYNVQPAISADGTTVVFDCGEDVYSQPPTSICEVNTDGTGFRVVWTPERGGVDAPGRADVALHSPDYLPDGSIVFEADWTGEQIWRLAGSGPPTRIAGEYSNDNSPCVLPNGCVVSLWLQRPGSMGYHELKVMDASGGNVSMLRTGVDISDTGLGCGG